MTLTEPLRRITLQLRQIFFTEALTFMCYSKLYLAMKLRLAQHAAATVTFEVRFFH